MTNVGPQPLHAQPPGWRRRWPGAAAVAAVVLLLHLGALGLWPMAPGPGWRGETRQPLQVRQIVAAAPTKLQPAAATPSKAVQDTPVPATTPRPMPAQTATQTSAQTATQTEAARPAPAEPQAPAATDTAAATAIAETPVGGDTPPGGSPVPVYATRLPDAVTLRYELRRGGDPGQQRGPGRGQGSGRAVLQWQPAGDGYELTLNNEWSGAQALGSSSRGHIAPIGLAPERHTESRRGRDARAANFQYDSARITFSGPSVEYPLVPGAQDRLSWLLQLTAIVEANPALQAPGSEISMFVVGSRGDGDVWVFSVQDRDDIELPAGRVARPVHLTREPRRPYDTRVEVWLDPARGHLPVRLHQWVRPTGQGTELLLESADPR